MATHKRNNIHSEKWIQYYKDMLLIRRFEEKAGQLYGMGLIGGFCHLYIGQEAVVVGVQDAIDEDDSVITSYRDHAHMLACGLNPDGVMAELTGRKDGLSKGKGGSMHMFSAEKNFYGGHGIVGAQVPIGAGLAFADTYLGNDSISTVYMGDGAVNQGQVYETFNMASLWKLPAVFIIENNRYAMGTSTGRHSALPDYHIRGKPYDIPGEQVDGMNVLAVYEATQKAAAYCRSGKGPYILEMMTYRYRGHSMSDPANYRSKEELNTMKSERDPIEYIKGLLIEGGYADEDTLKGFDKDIRKRIAQSADFATASPVPDAAELWTDVVA